MNLCRSCEQDFSSVRAFDKHRVGVHAFTYSEGLALDPPREDGRRCLRTDELEDAGFRLTASGRWELAAEADRARTAFARTADDAS
jgi:hypothetical protein